MRCVVCDVIHVSRITYTYIAIGPLPSSDAFLILNSITTTIHFLAYKKKTMPERYTRDVNVNTIQYYILYQFKYICIWT